MRRLCSLLVTLLLAPAVLSAQPAYDSSGTFTVSATTCTPSTTGATITADDILLVVAESENEAITLSTANSFVEIPDSPQSAGTAATDPANRIAVFWKRAVGGDAMPVVADSGNHTTCQLHVFNSAITSGDPWDVTAGGNDGGSNDTSAVIPGDTTTVDNTLVVLVQGTSFNGTSTAECGAATNSDLTSITERADNTNTSGLGGGHCLITGVKASAGAFGNTTLTLANTSFKGAIAIALKPVPPDTSQVTYVGTPVTNSGTGTTLTLSSVAITSGSDRLLVVIIGYESNSITVSSVVFNTSESLTQVTGAPVSNAGAGGFSTDVWYRVAPTQTTANVVITFSASVGAGAGTLQFHNVHQTTPISGYAEGASSGSAPSVTASPAADATDFVLSGVMADAAQNPTGTGHTERFQLTTPGFFEHHGSTRDGADGSVMAWNTSAFWAEAAMVIEYVSVAAAPKRLLLLGIGVL